MTEAAKEALLKHNEELIRRFNELDEDDSEEAERLLDEIAITESVFMANTAWRIPNA